MGDIHYERLTLRKPGSWEILIDESPSVPWSHFRRLTASASSFLWLASTVSHTRDVRREDKLWECVVTHTPSETCWGSSTELQREFPGEALSLTSAWILEEIEGCSPDLFHSGKQVFLGCYLRRPRWEKERITS